MRESLTDSRDKHLTPLRRTLNRRVLVLNQSYEPMSVCNAQRAVSLLLARKAELIEAASGLMIRAEKAHYPMPSVIRLWQYISMPYRNVELSRRNILRRDGHRCQYCGTNKPPLTLDHVMPKSRGGAESWENLVTACVRCNNKKGNRTPEEAGMKLSRPLHKPSHVFFIRDLDPSGTFAWNPYLFH